MKTLIFHDLAFRKSYQLAFLITTFLFAFFSASNFQFFMSQISGHFASNLRRKFWWWVLETTSRQFSPQVLNSVDFGASLMNPLVKILISSSKPPLFRAHFTSTFIRHLQGKKNWTRIEERSKKVVITNSLDKISWSRDQVFKCWWFFNGIRGSS